MSVYPSVQPTFKETVRAATTTNITLSAAQTVDGVALVAGDRCLVKDQTTATANGVYEVAAGAWTRARDASVLQQLLPGHELEVSEGTVNGKSRWKCANTGNIIIGTTNISYTRTFPDYSALWENPFDPSTLGDNIEREAATGTFLQTSGTLYLYGGFVLRAGITYSAINVFFTTAGTAVTHTWGGLVALNATSQYSARQLIAVSADNTVAPTANAFRVFTFGTAVTPLNDVPVYIALLLAATTTVPTIIATPAVANLAFNSQGVILSGTSNTALTTPQAVNTVENAATAIAQTGYAYLT